MQMEEWRKEGEEGKKRDSAGLSENSIGEKMVRERGLGIYH